MNEVHSGNFLEATGATVAAVMAAGDRPALWRLTYTAYLHMDAGRSHRDQARRVAIGTRAPRPLYGCPIDIVAGPTFHYQLLTESGATWDQDGLRIPASDARASLPATHGDGGDKG